MPRDTGTSMGSYLTVIQCIAALIYAASGVMKVFMFDKVSVDVPSFGALPRNAWMTLGVLELACVLGLVLPLFGLLSGRFTVVAAALLALESVVFIFVHVKYKEVGPIIMSGVLGLLMAFLAWQRAAQ